VPRQITGRPRPHGGGEHVGIEPEVGAYERHREPDLVVERAVSQATANTPGR